MEQTDIKRRFIELISQRLPIPWATDFPAAAAAANHILRILLDRREVLRELIERSWGDPRLRAMAEHFDRLDRFVIFDDLAAGLRIRLHVYPDAHVDGPHDHRWSFGAGIVTGRYCHRVYERPVASVEDLEMCALPIRFEQEVSEGSPYVLHHSVVHSVQAAPNTVSVIVRGPAEKEALLMTDLATGRSKWKYGINRETTEETLARVITRDRLGRIRKHLARLGIV